MKRYLDFHQLRPFVRVATDVTIQKDKRSQSVCGSDHRIFYIKSGSAIVTYYSVDHRVSEGTALYIKSGIPYRIRPDIDLDLSLIAINFDLTDAHKEITNCLPLIPAEKVTPEDQLEILEIKDVLSLNDVHVVSNAQRLLPFFHELVKQKQINDNYQDYLLSSILLSLLLCICNPIVQDNHYASDRDSCDEILDYLKEHYTDDISNSTLADIFGYHPNYISQMIQKKTGISLHQHLIHIRIQQAICLLQTTDTPVHEIAQAVGFRDVSYFSQYFKKITGHSPGKYRIGL